MRIGIVGYGNMGREVETQARKRSHEVLFRASPHKAEADVTSLAKLKQETLDKTDVLIEFSLANAVLKNAQVYSAAGVPAVIGTTGWEADKEAVQKTIGAGDLCCVYGANFSIGAQVFARVAEYAARLINKISDYDVALWEAHHTQKKDRPSGTALMTAERVLAQLARKNHIACNLPENEKVAEDALAVVSQRVGYERGFHELVIDSDFDTIALSHRARTRAGFALGAVLAAEWLVQNKHKQERGLIPVDVVIDALLGGAA